jgi:hypothetical protein
MPFMAKDVNKLTNSREPVIPDSTLSYLRGADPGLAERFAGVLGSKADLSLPGADGRTAPDYAGFLKSMHRCAAETKAPLGGSDFLIAPNLPVPNVLTTLYDRLEVPARRQRHARAVGATGLSAMRLTIDFDGAGRNDVVSLGYLRQGAETTMPDALLTFFDDSDVVLLEASGPLKGVTDIGAMPDMREVLISDVTFAARHILGLDGPELPPVTTGS